MTEIWFYHLAHQPLERALPTLLERSVARGWKAVVQATSEERVAALDSLLWTYSDASFLAHGAARDGDGRMQPIYLTTGPENPNGAAVRFLIEGADAAEILARGDASYERLILMFDGGDDDQLAGARAQWRRLKDEGRDLAYWQQDEDGRWTKKGVMGDHARTRLGLRIVIAAFYLLAGYTHLHSPEPFLLITPDFVPFKREVIFITGLCEIAGAIGLFIPMTRKLAGAGLALYALCVFPANIKQALEHIVVPGLPDTWWYHGPRLLLQPVLIWATLFSVRLIDWPARAGETDQQSAER